MSNNRNGSGYLTGYQHNWQSSVVSPRYYMLMTLLIPPSHVIHSFPTVLILQDESVIMVLYYSSICYSSLLTASKTLFPLLSTCTLTGKKKQTKHRFPWIKIKKQTKKTVWLSLIISVHLFTSSNPFKFQSK